jgi:antitoxin HicB
MNTDLCYPARISADGEAFLATFRDFPEAVTGGESDAETRAMAVDCLETCIAGRIRDREDMPRPSPRRRGEVPIPVPPLSAAKALLYTTMDEQGVSMAELARRMPCDFQQVRRLLDLGHRSRLDQLDSAFAALGKRLTVGVQGAT